MKQAQFRAGVAKLVLEYSWTEIVGFEKTEQQDTVCVWNSDDHSLALLYHTEFVSWHVDYHLKV